MKTKRYSTSSSSSDDEVLMVLKQAKDEQNGYKSLRTKIWEQCEFCDEIFKDRYTLYEHNIQHMIIPLITKKAHQCKECLRYFTTTEILKTHTLQHHTKIISPKNTNNTKGDRVEIKDNTDILRSILENQVLVKCENDINLLVNTNLSLNGNNKQKKDKATQRATKNDNNIINTDCSGSKNDDKPRNNIKMTITATESNSQSTHDLDSTKNCPENIKVEELNVKEEPPSPELGKGRGSSPIDDEIESIRQRLLFEEDIENTLFRDLSNVCQLNIETLCQEVTFDFDDALVVSDSDDNVSLGCNDRINISANVLNNSESGMNNFENAINHNGGIKFEDNTNDFGTRITDIQDRSNFENEINNFSYAINNSESETNSFGHEMNNSESGIKYLGNEIENIKINGSNNCIRLEMLNVNENVTNNVQKISETQYTKAIHCDILKVPYIWSCRYCRVEFADRFSLIQHEPIHLEVKKKHWVWPLCCLCDRYIAGNHYTLRNHIARKHPENVEREISHTTHNCTKCGLKYHNYTKHLQNYHEAYKCEICSLKFETMKQLTGHICGDSTSQAMIDRRNESQYDTNDYVVIKLCDLCFSFMKIYMQNRQNYEEIGSKTEFGVRQTCDKCNKEFFSVKLVKRRALKPVERADSQKADVDLMALHGLKASSVSQKAAEFGRKAADFGRKASCCSQKAADFVNRTKLKSKPLSNKDRLMKIRHRLKMMKMINKC